MRKANPQGLVQSQGNLEQIMKRAAYGIDTKLNLDGVGIMSRQRNFEAIDLFRDFSRINHIGSNFLPQHNRFCWSLLIIDKKKNILKTVVELIHCTNVLWN